MPLHPQVRALLQQIADSGAKPYHQSTVEEARRAFLARSKLPPSTAVVGKVEDRTVPGTDGNAMQLNMGGMAVGIVGVPLRYMHTPCELLSLTDVENCSRMMAAYCRKVKPDTDFTPRLMK